MYEIPSPGALFSNVYITGHIVPFQRLGCEKNAAYKSEAGMRKSMKRASKQASTGYSRPLSAKAYGPVLRSVIGLKGPGG